MFGGHAFLVGGHLAVAASSKGGLMLRCDPARTEALVREPGVGPMEMRGKEIDGWLRVDPGRWRPTRTCTGGSRSASATCPAATEVAGAAGWVDAPARPACTAVSHDDAVLHQRMRIPGGHRADDVDSSCCRHERERSVERNIGSQCRVGFTEAQGCLVLS